MIGKAQIEAFQSMETPFYYYDLDHLDRVVSYARSEAERYGYRIHYAMKANAESVILKKMLAHGLGVDCVSGAEVEQALAVGFDPDVIAFAGVGKADWEIDLSLDKDIFTLNVESIEELRLIAERAEAKGVQANVAIRLNPDVDANTHKYITTGLEENKFGISSWQVEEVKEVLRNSEHLHLRGLHFHIGSQIRSLEPFKNLCARINEINHDFLDTGFQIEHINAGGGLGIDYDAPDDINNPDFTAFFALFDKFLDMQPGQMLHFELGRALVANCGDLISRVLFVKKGLKTNFLILDAGMTELIRPALYQSVHRIENLSQTEKGDLERYDVVGPVCESSDCFGKAIALPVSKRGDLVAIRSAGAYGASMASNYNLRKLQPNYVHTA